MTEPRRATSAPSHPNACSLGSEDCLFLQDDTRYPAAFFADYEALACLSASENAETLLVLHRATGKESLAKCYLGENRACGVTEAALLQKLSYPAIPRYIAQYENETMLCVVRDYVAGLPLNEYASEAHPTQAQVVAIASQICDILAYLHSLTPPVIHRDIKPQNIIIDANGNAWLIDFGISREYDPAAAKDTRYFGTVDFAPPEQYGFSQTDNRTDIFSLGVLIGWLLTGESQPRKAMPKLDSPRLHKIVKTCTELTPDRRYASAVQVKKALQRADGHLQRRVLHAVICAAVSLACLCAGFAIGRYTDFTPPIFATNSVQFEEPLIEQAVRQTLGIPKNAPITEEDLLSVTELYIFGDIVTTNSEAFYAKKDEFVSQKINVHNGTIQTLNDLTHLKNLKIIRIEMQDITDIAPLSQLEALEEVDLNHNPIADVSPLAGLFSLRAVCVFDSRVSDFSSLASCPLLVNIDAGKTRVTSFDAFAGLSGLTFLKVTFAPLSSLAGIDSLAGLERLELGDVQDHDLTPLLKMPLLKEVCLLEGQRTDAERDLSGATFQVHFS